MTNSNQSENLHESQQEEMELNNTIPPQDIFAFNELRSCADLKRMYDKKQLDLSPHFQREQVWGNSAQTRFLDSLIKNLPIPSMCFSQDIETGKRIVIDGLQRISTIVRFLNDAENNGDFKLSNLEDIDERLSGKTAHQIAQETPEIIESIENVTIPVTILRSNFEKIEHMEYIFTIFHRLNTGGTRLNAQEIRNCIFSGNFNDLLFECAKDFKEELSILIGIQENNRFTYEEFVLRFFAFDEKIEDYNSQLTRFLNRYMKERRNLSESELFEKKQLFSSTMELFKEHLKGKVTNKEIRINSKIVAESLLYGISKNINSLKKKKTIFFTTAYENMRSTPAFSESELKGSTSTSTKVKSRLNAAKQVFRPQGLSS